jgi:hypothetical protein
MQEGVIEKKETWEGYAEKYVALLNYELEDNWVRGDIAVAVYKLHQETKKMYGKSEVLNHFLSATKETRSAFNQYRWVSSVFNRESNIRNLPVTWTQYRICAGIGKVDEIDKKIEWLKRSYDENWTCARLIEELKANNLQTKIEKGLVCQHCEKTITEESISISYKQKGKTLQYGIFCSIKCAQNYLANLFIEKRAKIETTSNDEKGFENASAN